MHRKRHGMTEKSRLSLSSAGNKESNKVTKLNGETATKEQGYGENQW